MRARRVSGFGTWDPVLLANATLAGISTFIALFGVSVIIQVGVVEAARSNPRLHPVLAVHEATHEVEAEKQDCKDPCKRRYHGPGEIFRLGYKASVDSLHVLFLLEEIFDVRQAVLIDVLAPVLCLLVDSLLHADVVDF